MKHALSLLALTAIVFCNVAAAQTKDSKDARSLTKDLCQLSREKGPNSASGVQARPMPHDSRLVVFGYDKNALFPIYTTFNRFTHFEFQDGEKVLSSFLNDESEWEQKVAITGQDIFVRSKVRGVSGTMTVITSKRRYQIELLDVAGCPDQSRYQRVSWVTHDGVFEAPKESDELPKAPKILGSESATSARQSAADEGMDDSIQLSKLNMNYSIDGDSDIKPERVFDDGSRTWVQFSKHLVLRPAIFAVSKEGVGEPVEYVPRGTYFVLPKTYQGGLLLKLGKQEVRIRNKAGSCGVFDSACREVRTSNITRD